MFPQIDNIRKVQFEEKKLKAFFLSFFFFYLFIYDTVFIYLLVHRTNYIQDFVEDNCIVIVLGTLFCIVPSSPSIFTSSPSTNFVLLVCPNTSSHHMVTYYLFDCRSESDFMSTPLGREAFDSAGVL